MKTLNVDLETYSDVDIKLGVYRYVDSPNFEILLFAYSVDGGDTKIIDMAQGEKIPTDIINAISSDYVIKIAFNAQFERVCLSKYLFEKSLYLPETWLFQEMLEPRQWRCTMVQSNELGLPGSLKQSALFLGVEEQKDSAGTQLINYFSKPCKPTKANGMRTRNLPEHDLEKWHKFKEYCKQDVRTEMSIADILNHFEIPESEWELYALDQEINDRGVMVDQDLADGAIAIMDELTEENMNHLKELTGLDNPNSLKQFKEWLLTQGHDFPTLGKDIVQGYINNGVVTGVVKEALETRLKLSNSSTKKYIMMENARCADGRVHGLVQFYGANRTGRWAGRLLQVQNLPRNYIKHLDMARELIKEKNIEDTDLIFGDTPDVLKQLIRTGLIAKAGHTFHVSDFSAIEARVIAWFAGEKWVLEAFETHGKIYEATAAKMFHPKLEDVDKDMRQRGKVATLALGYQGGTGALMAMGALEQGLNEEELQPLVDAWRKANRKIVQFWYDVQRAAIKALEQGGVIRLQKGLKFFKKDHFLFIQLPSGRRLSYAKARLQEGTYGPEIVYEGQGDRVGFSKLHTYGGKLVENIVQATARDVLAESMLRLNGEGYPIVFHVHDEVVAEVEKGLNVEIMNDHMAIGPEWAKGLPLNAEGYETDYYKKIKEIE